MRYTAGGVVGAGFLAYIVSVVARWLVVNNQYLAPLLVWFWHLSFFGMIGFFVIAVVTIFWLAPRLIGLALTHVVLKALPKGCRVTVDSANFFQLSNVSVTLPPSDNTLRVAEIALKPTFRVATQAVSHKWFAAVIRGTAARVYLSTPKGVPQDLPGSHGAHDSGMNISFPGRPGDGIWDAIKNGVISRVAKQTTAFLSSWLELVISDTTIDVVLPVPDMEEGFVCTLHLSELMFSLTREGRLKRPKVYQLEVAVNRLECSLAEQARVSLRWAPNSSGRPKSSFRRRSATNLSMGTGASAKPRQRGPRGSVNHGQEENPTVSLEPSAVRALLAVDFLTWEACVDKVEVAVGKLHADLHCEMLLRLAQAHAAREAAKRRFGGGGADLQRLRGRQYKATPPKPRYRGASVAGSSAAFARSVRQGGGGSGGGLGKVFAVWGRLPGQATFSSGGVEGNVWMGEAGGIEGGSIHGSASSAKVVLHRYREMMAGESPAVVGEGGLGEEGVDGPKMFVQASPILGWGQEAAGTRKLEVALEGELELQFLERVGIAEVLQKGTVELETLGGELVWDAETDADRAEQQRGGFERGGWLQSNGIARLDSGRPWMPATGGGVAPGLGVVSLHGHVGVKEVHVYVDPANPVQAVWLKEALAEAMDTNAGASIAPDARAARRSAVDPGVGLAATDGGLGMSGRRGILSHLLVQGKVSKSVIEVKMSTMGSVPFTVQTNVGEIALDATDLSSVEPVDDAVGLDDEEEGAGGVVGSLAVRAKMKLTELQVVVQSGRVGKVGEGRAVEGVLAELETLAGYVQLHGKRLSETEPVLVEVSGLRVWLDYDLLQLLALAQPVGAAPESEASKGSLGSFRQTSGSFSSRGGGSFSARSWGPSREASGIEREKAGGASVRVHMQNMKVLVGTHFGEEQSGRWYGRVSLELVKGLLDKTPTSTRLSLPGYGFDSTQPAVRVRYLEWDRILESAREPCTSVVSVVPGSTAGMGFGGHKVRVPAVRCRRRKVVDVFALHSVTLKLKKPASDGDLESALAGLGASGKLRKSPSGGDLSVEGEGMARWLEGGMLGSPMVASPLPRMPREDGESAEEGREREEAGAREEQGMSGEGGTSLELSGVRGEISQEVLYGLVEVGFRLRGAAEDRASFQREMQMNDAMAARSSANLFARQSAFDDDPLRSIRPDKEPRAAPLPPTSFAVHDVWLSINLSTFEAPGRSKLAVELMHARVAVRRPLATLRAVPVAASFPLTVHADLKCLSVHRLHEKDAEWPPSLDLHHHHHHGHHHHSHHGRHHHAHNDHLDSGWVERGQRSDILLRVLRAKVGSPEGDAREWTVRVTEPVVVIPMPYNISLHGRREGRAGKWEQQRVGREGIVQWTNLGTLVNDGVLMMKAFLVLVKGRLRHSNLPKSKQQRAAEAHRQHEPPPPHKPSTDFPEGLPPVHATVEDFQVRFQDDPFEVWVGSVFRLHQDEAAQRLAREQVMQQKLKAMQRPEREELLERRESWKSSTSVGSTLNGRELGDLRREMEQELARYHAAVWKRRVNKLRRADCLVRTPPLMRMSIASMDGIFFPRSARYLQGRMHEVDWQSHGPDPAGGQGGAADAQLPMPKFDTMIGGEFQGLTISGLSVRLRDYPDPMLAVHSIEVTNFENTARENPGGSPSRGSPEPRTGSSLSDYVNPHALLFATEEVAPPQLIRTVDRKVHASASAVPMPRSLCPTKIWFRFGLRASSPVVHFGPCLAPSINIVSLVAAGLSPESLDSSPPLPSWDKARMLLHGSLALRADRASARLLADRSPYSATEIFELSSNGLLITVGDYSDGQAHFEQGGRTYIEAQKVQWEIHSKKKGMASAMLEKKSFFRAVEMSITIRMHWKCLGLPLQHHMCHILQPASPKGKDLVAGKYLGWASKSQSFHNARPPPAPSRAVHLLSPPPALRNDSAASGDFEDAISPAAQSPGRSPSELRRRSTEGWIEGQRAPSAEQAGADLGRSASAAAGGECADTYKMFRSSAVALSVRISTVGARSWLHVNSLRWMEEFSASFDKEADPVNRYSATVRMSPEGEERSKTLNAKTSFGKHMKAICVMVFSEMFELDCFYVGEQRSVDADGARAKALIIKFSGEDVDVSTRVERKAKGSAEGANLDSLRLSPQDSAIDPPRPAPDGAAPALAQGVAAWAKDSFLSRRRPLGLLLRRRSSGGRVPGVQFDGLGPSKGPEDAEAATGVWEVVDMFAQSKNVIAFQVPPGEVVQPRGPWPRMPKAQQGRRLAADGGHPIASAERVSISKGESVNKSQAASGRGGSTSPRASIRERPSQRPGLGKDVHGRLMRQKSEVAFKRPARQLRLRPGRAMEDLVQIAVLFQTKSGKIHNTKYRMREYKNVFSRPQFEEWAVEMELAESKPDAEALAEQMFSARLMLQDTDPSQPRAVGDEVFCRLNLSKQQTEEAQAQIAAGGSEEDWSRMWGRNRKGRGESCAGETPRLKFAFHKFCLQWNMETRELNQGWLALLTLATRNHEPKRWTVEAPPPEDSLLRVALLLFRRSPRSHQNKPREMFRQVDMEGWMEEVGCAEAGSDLRRRALMERLLDHALLKFDAGLPAEGEGRGLQPEDAVYSWTLTDEHLARGRGLEEELGPEQFWVPPVTVRMGDLADIDSGEEAEAELRELGQGAAAEEPALGGEGLSRAGSAARPAPSAAAEASGVRSPEVASPAFRSLRPPPGAQGSALSLAGSEVPPLRGQSGQSAGPGPAGEQVGQDLEIHAEDPVVRHLINSRPSKTSVPSLREDLRPTARSISRSNSLTSESPEDRHKSPHPDRAEVELQLVMVFSDAQLGVESPFYDDLPHPGIERAVIFSREAVLRKTRWVSTANKKCYEAMELQMEQLEAFIVRKDREDRDLEKLKHRVGCRGTRLGIPRTSLEERWFPTVWQTGDARMDEAYLIPTLSLKGDPQTSKKAMVFEYKYEVAELVNAEASESRGGNAPRGAAGGNLDRGGSGGAAGDAAASGARPDQPDAEGAEVVVEMCKLEFKTSSSELVPFFNVFQAIITPLKEDAELEEEVQKFRCMVALIPEAANELDTINKQIEDAGWKVEVLQDEFSAMISSMNISEASALPSAERHRMHNKKVELNEARQELAKLHDRKQVLIQAGQASGSKTRPTKLRFVVSNGTWDIGPHRQPFARMTLGGLRFTKTFLSDDKANYINNQIILETFELDSLLNKVAGPGEVARKEQILGPMHDDDMYGEANMLQIEARMLQKPEGEQPEYRWLVFEVHPVKIHITEEMYSALYSFAFPGKWESAKDGSGQQRWVDDPAMMTEDAADAAAQGRINQKREFYRLVPYSPKPPTKGKSQASFIFGKTFISAPSSAPTTPDALALQHTWSEPIPPSAALGLVDTESFHAPPQPLSPPALDSLASLPPSDANAVSFAPSASHVRNHSRALPPVEERDNVQQMRLRARNHMEFSEVYFLRVRDKERSDTRKARNSLDIHPEELKGRPLHVSFSFKAKKGSITPDIDTLVVQIPQVKFPNDENQVLILTWQDLYHLWFKEVKYAIMTQVARGFWGKITWRRRGSTVENGKEDEGKKEEVDSRRHHHQQRDMELAKASYPTKRDATNRSLMEARKSYGLGKR